MSTPSVLIWKKEKNKILNYMAIAKKRKIWLYMMFEFEKKLFLKSKVIEGEAS